MIPFDSSQRIGAVCSMALIILMQIETGEVLKTVILAAIGGASSYVFTLAVKMLIDHYRRKF